MNSRKRSRRNFVLSQGFVTTITALVAWGIYEAFSRDYAFEVRETRIDTNNALNAPLRIAFLSDLHLRNTTAQFQRLAKIINEIQQLNPDLILLGGDFTGEEGAETAAFQRELLDGLRPLTTIAPAYTVLGNHEWWTANDWAAALEGVGITVIENKQRSLTFKQGDICLRGLGDAFTGHYRPQPFEVQCKGVPLTLTHDPLAIEIDDEPGLYLAGHTHCGQIRLPIIGAPWAPTLASAEYQCGIGDDGSKVWLVTAGLGSSIINARLGTTPAIELITLN